jgi:capsular polysaccharide biosynthesis protein
MTFEETIKEIRKRKILFIGMPLMIFVFTYALQYRVFQTYESTSSFIVNETDMSDMSGPSEFKSNIINSYAINVNRILLFAHSSQMTDHLIKKYRLYLYYQIDPKSKFAHEKLVNRLTNNIRLKKSEFNIVGVTVRDRDRVMASSMANEIVTMINTINEAYLKTQLRRKIVLYQALYLDMQKGLAHEEDKILNIIESYKGLINSLEKNKIQTEGLRYSLNDLVNSIKNKKEEIVNMQQLNFVLLQTIDKEHLETLTVINWALPDYRSNVLSFLAVSFGITILFFFSMILLLNSYFTYRKQIYFLFGKS